MRRILFSFYRLNDKMNIENPLMTGTDLESLHFQATMLKGTANKLAIESATAADQQKAMNPFLGFVSRVKNFTVSKLALVPSLKNISYKPAYTKLDRLNTLNFGTIRSLIIPSIPDTNAKMHDYLDYLNGLSRIVNNVITETIPGCKIYFSNMLEDVSVLSSSSQSAAIGQLSNNQFALENLKKQYPGIIKRNDANFARLPMSQQYDSIKDFISCQDFLTDIAKSSSSIKVEDASRQVNELNEIISRIIMKVKQKKEIEIDSQAVAAISGYLYTLAEEITMVSAFVTHLQMAIKVLGEQVDDLSSQAGV